MHVVNLSHLGKRLKIEDEIMLAGLALTTLMIFCFVVMITLLCALWRVRHAKRTVGKAADITKHDV